LKKFDQNSILEKAAESFYETAWEAPEVDHQQTPQKHPSQKD
jgi:hypothetical protein